MLPFLFFIIDLYFFIPAVIAHISSPIAELIIPVGISIKESEIEIQ